MLGGDCPKEMSKKGKLAVSNKKNGRKIMKKIRMAHIYYLPSGIAFTKKEMGSNLMKSEEKQDKDNFTYQGPSNRSLGGWSHDQLPKWSKNESCSPAL